MIGHFAAVDAPAARAVLHFACQQLAFEGCTLAVGPMDGSTWRNYRAVIDEGERPPFFLEPQNPLAWVSYFAASGFDLIAHYFSAETTDLGIRRRQLERLGNRLAAQDITVEALQPDQLDEQLGEIYSIVQNTFRHNLFYAPLEKSQYLRQFRQLSRRVPFDFVLIARRRGEPVGFLFALPDLLQQNRGEAIDTLIIKSIGVSPGFENAGIGQLLLASVDKRAEAHGYRRIIHALMRDIPRLRRLSARDAVPMRRYALFAKVLGK
jgi:GNAT superfamily N-acetyltransferase